MRTSTSKRETDIAYTFHNTDWLWLYVGGFSLNPKVVFIFEEVS
jgi:hypothetical protein